MPVRADHNKPRSPDRRALAVHRSRPRVRDRLRRAASTRHLRRAVRRLKLSVEARRLKRKRLSLVARQSSVASSEAWVAAIDEATVTKQNGY